MTKHILCAVDLTHLETEAALLKRAADLANFYGAELSVISVIPDYGMPIVGSFFDENQMVEAARLADLKLIEFVQTTLPDFGPVQHILEIGTAYEKILKAIEKTGADLVVMGAHKPDLADRLQGPNSSRVVRYAPCSVLVIRA